MPSCAIALCQSTHRTMKLDGNLSFHHFPKDKNISKIWETKCKRADRINTKTAVVCSTHFDESDFLEDKMNKMLNLKERNILKPGAVPSLNLPIRKHSVFRTKNASRETAIDSISEQDFIGEYNLMKQSRLPIDYIADFRQSATVCSNCNKNEPIASGFKEKKNTTERNEEIKVWDVITYVFRVGNVSWKQFKNDFIEEKNSYQENEIGNVMEEPLKMCELCLSLLSDTYKLLKQFESLTHQASLIQQIKNISTIKWENSSEAELSVDPHSLTLSTPCKTENENLVDSFNCDDNQANFEQLDCSFEECKYETEDLFDNESSASFEDSTLPVDQSHSKSIPKMSSKSAKRLMVKLERLSEKDLKHYSENRRTQKNFTTELVQLKSKKRAKQMKKLECSTAIKRKYSRKQKLVLRKIPEDEIEAECIICGEKFANRFILRREHMPTHLKDMSCKLCDKSFTRLYALLRHMKDVHILKKLSKEELAKQYTACEICGISLKIKSYKPHMEKLHGHGVRVTFKCDKCDRAYLTKFSYRDHLLTHLDNFTPFLCRHCGKALNDKRALKNHERRHSPDEKKLSCKLCPKKFYVKNDLDSHVSSIHCDEKKFVCDECGIGFKLKNGLRFHKRKHEDVALNGEYSAKCKYCEKVFKHNLSLRLHLKIHEKVYECSFCGKTLSSKPRLRCHENRHKNNPDYHPRKHKTCQPNVSNQPTPNEYKI